MSLAPQAATPAAKLPDQNSRTSALALLTTLFFMWGLLTSLNDVLVPHLKSIFSLNYAEVMLIQFSFFSAYAIFSIPSGKLIDRIGYQRAMTASLITMGLGAFLFIPAASVPSFPLFLAALLILGMGITALQVAANPYVTVLGPARTASSRLNLTQAFNSLGTTVGPFLGSLVILGATPLAAKQTARMSAIALEAYRLQQAATVKLPYLGLAAVLFGLAALIGFSRLPAIPGARRLQTEQSSEPPASVWKQRHLVLGAVGIFAYVGAEVGIGSFLINYMSQPSIGGVSASVAARFASVYWGGAMVGRFAGSAILRKIRTSAALAACAAGAFTLVLTSILTTGHAAMASILCVGLFNSIMFPSIFTLGVAKLGPLTGDGSGVMATAIVGGAAIPLLEGGLADHVGIQHALLLPAICYLYVFYYALKGSKPRGTLAGLLD